jgi:hypothetical protein
VVASLALLHPRPTRSPVSERQNKPSHARIGTLSSERHHFQPELPCVIDAGLSAEGKLRIAHVEEAMLLYSEGQTREVVD